MDLDNVMFCDMLPFNYKVDGLRCLLLFLDEPTSPRHNIIQLLTSRSSLVISIQCSTQVFQPKFINVMLCYENFREQSIVLSRVWLVPSQTQRIDSAE